jgi:hypothetical protein
MIRKMILARNRIFLQQRSMGKLEMLYTLMPVSKRLVLVHWFDRESHLQSVDLCWATRNGGSEGATIVEHVVVTSSWNGLDALFLAQPVDS